MNFNGEKVNQRDEKGATALEYALMAACIAIVAITGVSFYGQSVSDMFMHNSDTISTAINS